MDARVIMPLYGDLKFRDKLEYVTNYSVPVGWRSQYCGLFKAEVDGVTYYFLDNEYYFKRRGLYGFYDDGERFAFFSRAVLETLFYIDFTPDIINCNDWQTALVPVYLNLYYRHLDKFNRIKTVFTIHNIAYQGKYNRCRARTPKAGNTGVGHNDDGNHPHAQGTVEAQGLKQGLACHQLRGDVCNIGERRGHAENDRGHLLAVAGIQDFGKGNVTALVNAVIQHKGNRQIAECAADAVPGTAQADRCAACRAADDITVTNV